jgi:hypothetical protein
MAPELSPSRNPADIDDAAVALPDGNLEAGIASPCAINKESATAIYALDVAEAAIAEQPFALAAGYPPASVEIGSDGDADRLGNGGGRQRHRRHHQQAENKSQRYEQILAQTFLHGDWW